MQENGRYRMENPEQAKSLIAYKNGDFRGIKFEELTSEVTVIDYNDGGWVYYLVDGDSKKRLMEEYPFERIYQLIEE